MVFRKSLLPCAFDEGSLSIGIVKCFPTFCEYKANLDTFTCVKAYNPFFIIRPVVIVQAITEQSKTPTFTKHPIDVHTNSKRF